MDEFEAGNGADCLRNFLKERVAFDLAAGAKACGDGIERGIVVAGVADKFPCSFGQRVEEIVEGTGVELASGGDADGAVGRDDVSIAQFGKSEE